MLTLASFLPSFVPALALSPFLYWLPAVGRCNAVAPWYTNTPLAQQVLADESYKRQVLARTPMGRTGEPEEVADVIAFLCMPASAFVTGQIIAVDGGYSSMGFW